MTFFEKYNFIKKNVQRRIWSATFAQGFQSFGRGSYISALTIKGMKNVSIGNNVLIEDGAEIFCVKELNVNPSIEIGNNTKIRKLLHLTCIKKIYIGSNVLIANNVLITDNYHKFDNVDEPIRLQGLALKGEVIIGENAWIGENACILGAKVGKHSIVGANSVVTKDIPDYSIAVGNPAKVIKHYDHENKIWIPIERGNK